METFEGGLGAPTRHPIKWKEPSFVDPKLMDEEMRRVFDVCHSCRRCFNLCDSFPRLFDIIDESDSGELDSVSSSKFDQVEEACTLCDLCYMSKCPYVPPHEFNIDFPHLILRYRYAKQLKNSGLSFINKIITNTDLTGRIGTMFSPIINWSFSKRNYFTRKTINFLAGIHLKAILPKFNKKTFSQIFNSIKKNNLTTLASTSRKVVIYTTCYVNYNLPKIAEAALKVLNNNNVEVQFIYPECCGMPKLESGDLESVSKKSMRISKELLPWVKKGYKILTLTPSCSLMLKSEWQLLNPDNEIIREVSIATQDICEYIVDIAKEEDFFIGENIFEKNISLHIACHTKAQNIGVKSSEMLKKIPNLKINIIDKCSGHGGSFGVREKTYPLANKYGKISARKLSNNSNSIIVSECPLAAQHLGEIDRELSKENIPKKIYHPIEIIAETYLEGKS